MGLLSTHPSPLSSHSDHREIIASTNTHKHTHATPLCHLSRTISLVVVVVVFVTSVTINAQVTTEYTIWKKKTMSNNNNNNNNNNSNGSSTGTTKTTTTTTTYSQVLFKKTEGSLILTNDSLSFAPVQEEASVSSLSPSVLSYAAVIKHQVSPPTYPKCLLKIVLNNDGKSLTFQLTDRDVMESVRKDLTTRLRQFQNANGTTTTTTAATTAAAAATSDSTTAPTTLSGKKRSHAELLQRSSSSARKLFLSQQNVVTNGTSGVAPASSLDDLDPTALAVTRSSLLAANPTLRAQHTFLVEETKTVEEDDFWKTHNNLLQEEYAKICGMARAGTSSLLQSHLPLQGRVTLGVEEMRQIFVLYPAVHKAYEEKVPLELSDEQFWRKYLESEYFHRDRGRLGTAARNHAADASADYKKAQKAAEDQDARAAAVGTDDLFSRYDQKLREEQRRREPQMAANVKRGGTAMVGSIARAKKWGTELAVGQFDLASTFETERGQLLEGPRDNHPLNQMDDGRGSKVIQKYNRHWAMVLHPEQAVAGSNLVDVAHQSVADVLDDDEDAKANGGLDKEMKKLIGFAMADKEDANHATGTGYEVDSDDGILHEESLTLKNVEAYYSGQQKNNQDTSKPISEEESKREAVFSQALASKMKAFAAQKKQESENGTSMATLIEESFPPAETGRNLMSALTKKMAQDSKTNAATLEIVKTLPEDFKKRLHSYFRRSSELLRHFFGLRQLESQGNMGTYSKKLSRIVGGMETFYREMEEMRKTFAQTEIGELQRKMCDPIMDQLDWAFKLHREGIGGAGRGGGFVTVEEL